MADTKVAQQENIDETIQPSLGQRIRRGMKHPFRAAWHVVLRVNDKMRKRRSAIRRQRYERKAVARQRSQIKRQWRTNLRRIKQGKRWYLRDLRPSELLLYVLRAPVNKYTNCKRLETNLDVRQGGNVSACCLAVVPFGNLLYDGELDELYHSTYARIVKLSSVNKTYCLCDLYNWYDDKKCIDTTNEDFSGSWFTVGIDQTCNLCCKSCRTKKYVSNSTEQRMNTILTDKILRSGYLERAKGLTMASMGEVFYSPHYRRLLNTGLQCQNIDILSNGTLLNRENWRLLDKKYTTINLRISVDAATAETYQKLRGGNFEQLLENLTMLGNLRRQGKIKRFHLNFLVQRDNYREMVNFVKLGQQLHVDQIDFQWMCDWGVLSKKEYLSKCLIIDQHYLEYELWKVLQDPIFQDPIVDWGCLQRYIDNSEKLYRTRYEREQKQYA